MDALLHVVKLIASHVKLPPPEGLKIDDFVKVQTVKNINEELRQIAEGDLESAKRLRELLLRPKPESPQG